MSIHDTKYILELQDINKTKLCAFCGQPIQIIPNKDQTGNVRDWTEWEEYECSCAKWIAYEQMMKELKELGNAFHATYSQYLQKNKEVIEKYGIKPSTCVFKLK